MKLSATVFEAGFCLLLLVVEVSCEQQQQQQNPPVEHAPVQQPQSDKETQHTAVYEQPVPLSAQPSLQQQKQYIEKVKRKHEEEHEQSLQKLRELQQRHKQLLQKQVELKRLSELDLDTNSDTFDERLNGNSNEQKQSASDVRHKPSSSHTEEGRDLKSEPSPGFAHESTSQSDIRDDHTSNPTGDADENFDSSQEGNTNSFGDEDVKWGESNFPDPFDYETMDNVRVQEITRRFISDDVLETNVIYWPDEFGIVRASFDNFKCRTCLH